MLQGRLRGGKADPGQYAGPPMRRLAETLVRTALLGGWVVLAFFSGGYDDGPRLVMLAVCAAALALALGAGERVLPRSVPARVALAALALLSGWTALSHGWAPLADAADDALERDLLYLAALFAGALVWRCRHAASYVEPLLAGGVVIVIGYALAGRLVPGLVEQHASVSAGGRLEQPLTYWNATGALAGLGLVQTARLAGDRARAAWLRAAASAAAPLLAMGLVLSFSRGALAATVGGLLVLLVLAPTWTQLRAVAICLEAGAVAVFAALAAPSIRTAEPGDAQGALVLLALVAMALIAAATTAYAARAEEDERVRLGRLPLPAYAPALALTACALALLIPVLAGGRDSGRQPVQRSARASELASVQSNRYDYWRVGLEAFADHPLRGVGAGGFQTEWLKHRPYPEGVKQAHSLQVQTLTDLGLVGALLLAVFLGAVGLCARRVQRDDPALASGACAVLVVWLMHATIDWDWEIPALTLAALLPAGVLLAQAQAASPRRRSSAETRGPAAAMLIDASTTTDGSAP